MSFWESNCVILRKQYPGLIEEICRECSLSAREDDDLAPEDIHIESAVSGAPALSIRGIHVHSPRDPAREGRRLAETISAPAGPIIILGFGLGYAAEAAAEIAPERPLIIVEKYCSLLRKALELRDLEKLLSKSKIVFVPGGSGEGISPALSLFEEDGEKSAPAIIRNRALINLDEEWYGAVEDRIRTWTMRDDVNMATFKRFGKRWVRNLSRNMSAIRDLPGISRLTGFAAAIHTPCAGGGTVAANAATADTVASPDVTRSGAEALPVFLAAAGPGLDSVGPLLPEISRCCIVVAVDTSLRFLIKHGVDPDFVLVVDPQFWNSRHLDRSSGHRTRLIAESAVYPPVLRLPFKGIYLCGSLFPLGSFIEQRVDPKGPLGAGGSVATTAWDFARTLGAQDIWIAGLDLAFPGLKTHFRGALFEDRSHAESGRRSPAETWLVRALRDGIPFLAPAASGGQVLTDRRLSLYAAWFENRFHRHPEVRNHSLSPSGLAIAGLEPVDAATLLALPDRREEINQRLDAAFSRIENDFFAPEESRRRTERYENAVSTLLHGLENIKNAAEKGAKNAEQAMRRSLNPSEQKKILANLDEITQAITQSEVKEVAGFLFPPAEVANMSREGAPADTQSPGDPFRAYLKSSVRLYRSLAEAAEFNLRELKR
ncbi:hypothetical protein AGMMS50293_08470 [Spirochaetia bacterium]|nr:hypothetical protein AGMMS50293_08470 [Spirochaetia bacterium]